MSNTCLGQNPLIGAYYFDGWAGTNKVKNEAWAINAPTHLTKNLHVNTRIENLCGDGVMMI